MYDFIKAAQDMADENKALKEEVATLKAKLGEAHEITAPVTKKKCLREIIQPLHVKRGYTGERIPGSLYAEVYGHMDVDWQVVMLAYIQEHNGVIPNNGKTLVVEADPALTAEFERVVNILLAQ